MLRQLASPFAHLGRRSFAQTSLAIDDLRASSRELQRMTEALTQQVAQMARLLAEQQGRHDVATSQAASQMRDMQDQLARLTQRESQLRAILKADVAQESRYEKLPSALDKERIEQHVRAALDNATLHTEPFPYVVVESLFPRRFYGTLVGSIPPVEIFADNPVNHQQLPVPFTLAPAYSRRVWKFMAEEVVESIMVPAIVDKFRAPLEAWIGENWPQLADNSLAPPMVLHGNNGRIMRRERGYNIPPHRDPKWGFITGLIYLVRPGDLEAWGTTLYAVDGDREALGAKPHWIDVQDCRLVREVPFRANSALLWLNSCGAHGASIPEDAEPADLDRYAYQFRIGPTRDSIEALMDLLPADRRQAWAGKIEK